MTTASPSAAPASALRRRTSSIFLAPRGDGSRRRSGSDALKFCFAILIYLALWVGVSPRGKLQSEIANALHPPAPGLSWLVTLLWALTSIGTVALVAVAAVMGRRLEIFRDVGVAGVLAWGASVACQNLFSTTARFPASYANSVAGVDLGFPVPILAISVAVILASLPYLSRQLQRVLEMLIAVAVLTGLMKGVGLPAALLASVVVGWGSSALMHLVFGSPTGVPDSAAVNALLQDLEVSVTDVAPLPRQQWGLARFAARATDGSLLRISLYGHDTRDSQLFAKIYRTVWLRNDVGPFVVTRAQQVDHECYLTLLAAQAAPRGAVPVVVASGIVGGSKDALVVSSLAPGWTLTSIIKRGGEVSDAALAAMARIMAQLRAERLAHGSIDPDRFLLDGDDVVLVDYDRARTHAPEEALDRDAAALLVTMALAVGAERAAVEGVAGLGTETVAGALQYIQDPALPPSLVSTIRRQKARSVLGELREAAARAAGTEMPKLAELKRVSWTNLILGVGTLIGAWALIGVFLNVAQAASTIMSAQWAWVALTALVAQVAYLGSAMSSMGSVTATLPYFPLVILELSNTFSGLALGTPAVLAARIRFFQKQGVDTTVAVSSGVLVSTASWIVKGGLFLISLPFALSSIHLSQVVDDSASGSEAGSHQTMLVLIVLAVVLVGIGIAAVLVVPRWRKLVADRIAPKLHEVVDHFKVLIRFPRKLIEIFGGMVIAQLSVAFTLGTSLHAFGVSLSLPVILVVLTMGSVLGGISPVPGGMGVVEAGMILGLRAAGVPAEEAVSAVFIQRLFTAYLPPVAGWFALVWLRRKEYL